MSNCYLCDECGNAHSAFTVPRYDFTDCFQYGMHKKIVLPDGYEGDQKKLCAHWKEIT